MLDSVSVIPYCCVFKTICDWWFLGLCPCQLCVFVCMSAQNATINYPYEWTYRENSQSYWFYLTLRPWTRWMLKFDWLIAGVLLPYNHSWLSIDPCLSRQGLRGRDYSTYHIDYQWVLNEINSYQVMLLTKLLLDFSLFSYHRYL